MKKFRSLGAITVVLTIILTCFAAAVPAFAANPRWIGSWGTPAIESGVSLFSDSSSSGLHLTDIIPANSTIRSTLRCTAGGSKVRFKFSNAYGTSALTINSCTVAKSLGEDDIDTSTIKPVTWNNGDSFVVIPAGQEVYSDAIDFPVGNLEDIAVSTYYRSTTRITTQGMYGSNTYITSALGDRTRADSMGVTTSLLKFTSNTISYYVTPFLTRMDVLSENGFCVVLIGDSTITNDVYLCLEEKLMNAGIKNVGVVMSGIIGNKVLRDGAGILATVYGEPLIKRFSRDALDVAGCDYIIIKEGVNDIIHPYSKTMKYDKVTPQEMATGYYQLANAARAAGKVVSICEISPYKGYERNFAGVKDMEWQQEAHDTLIATNALLQQTGSAYFNYIINLDKLVDPNDPTKIQNQLTVDGAHLSKAGQVAFTDLIPEGAYGVSGNLPDLAAIRNIDPYAAAAADNTPGSSSNATANAPGSASQPSGTPAASASPSGDSGDDGSFWDGIVATINTFIPGNRGNSAPASDSGVGDTIRRTISGIASGLTGSDAAPAASADNSGGANFQSPNVITPIDGANNVSANSGSSAPQVLVASDANVAAAANAQENNLVLTQTRRMGLLIILSCMAAVLLLAMFMVLRAKSGDPILNRAAGAPVIKRFRQTDKEV